MSAAHDYPNRVIDPRDETIATLRAQLAAALAGQGRDTVRLDWTIKHGHTLWNGNGAWFVLPESHLDSRGYPPASTPRYPSAIAAIDAAIATTAENDAGGAQGEGR